MLVARLLLEPPEFSVAIEGTNLALVQGDAVALERLPQGLRLWDSPRGDR